MRRERALRTGARRRQPVARACLAARTFLFYMPNDAARARARYSAACSLRRLRAMTMRCTSDVPS